MALRHSSKDQTGTNAGFLSGGGELGELMRQRDWSQSPLGPVSGWPQALRTAVRIMLTSRQAMFVWWGDSLINLYNDAYKSIVGGKHPQALGQPASVVWREIWDQVGPRAQSAMNGDEGTYDEALLLIMERYGYPEETYYTFSYSPVPNDEGGAGGILCANTDDTQRIIGGRQLALLRELATRTADARTIEDACRSSARSLETNQRDLPFALLYLLDLTHQTLILTETVGIQRGHVAAPEVVDLDDESVWPFAEVLRTHQPEVVRNLETAFGILPTGAWEKPPTQAVVLPIPASGQDHLTGVLVAGLNPYRLLDDTYQGFLSLVAGQIAAAITNALAYEAERKRAEALAELDRAKTAFFSNVSHELRTPLTLLLGPVEDALSRPEEQQSLAREDLDLLHRNGQRLLKLVNTLLDFSRIEAGRIQANYEPVDLAAFTAELASMFRAAFERAGLSLTIDCPPLPEPVFIDREMWEKIVFNLLSNAFKFTLTGGVTIRLRAVSGWAELRVTDTGIGIPAEELPHIFERFHRVTVAQARTNEGAGIGLALVYELAKLHGGDVKAESRPGEGSAFTLRLPLGNSHLPAERIGAARVLTSTAIGASPFIEEALRWLPTTSDAPLPEVTDLTFSHVPERSAETTAQCRLLIADDNADMRDYLKRLLEDKYEVETVANGNQALERIHAQPPDLVLSDVMMPERDGFGLLQSLRADPRTQTLPIILLSARAGEEAKVEGMEAGADDYLIKPFSARELLARIDARIELAQVRKAAEKALRESETRFRRLFEANIFSVAFNSFDGRIIDANDAYLNMVGYTREDLANGHIRWDKMTSPEYQNIDLRAQEQLRKQGFCTPYEKEYLRKDGTRVPILIGAAFLAEPYEAQDTCVSYSLDLTQQKRMDEQLRQTQKLESLGLLAGGVAHDFNNLLVGILGNASLALETMPSSDPNYPLLEGVVQAGERAADLTRQLLAYAGKGRFVIKPIQLSSLIREIATLLHASISKNVQLQLDLQESLPDIEGDASQIQQLIMNLIINGAEAMGEENGTVYVSTGVRQVDAHYTRTMTGGQDIAPGNYVWLRVQDTGCGMDEETLAKIFDPFFTTKFIGRGLGLAAAQGIVRVHKGAITVYSTVGKGTTFEVLLPAQASTSIANAESAPQQDLTGTGLALVVDDEELVRRMAKAGLQRYGYTVLTAENGQEAVDLFREFHERVAIIVLDMTMPVMSGEEALEHLKAIAPNVRVILSSGFNEVEAVKRFLGKGLAGFLQKPYTSAQLAEKIKAVMLESAAS